VDPGLDGCVLFPANTGPDTIEYVIVAQSAAGEPNRQADFQLSGDTVYPTAAAVLAGLRADAAEPTPAERFHALLRDTERSRAYPPGPAGEERAELALTAPPPQVGDNRQFSVCANLLCNAFTKVGAEAVAVGQHIAIFVDTLDLGVGLVMADYDSLVTMFDTRLYPIDTLAFGRESDVDANGVVLVVMTRAINRLVTSQQCGTSGYVTGYFYGADVDPGNAQNTNFNHGEVFYALVADPAGTHSCAHPVSQIKRVVPITFVHEFQHMISYNQHVLQRSGFSEVLWLNEGLSHYAEELAGRSFLPGNDTAFSRYLQGNVTNAYQYLDNTGSHFLVATAGSGSLAERGSAWLFVRYLVDQFATDTTAAAWSVVTRGLLLTSQTGAANVVTRTGQPFDLTVARWALTNWVSDLSGFATPAELRYRSWGFRTTFDSLNAQNPAAFPKRYPLTPTISVDTAVNVSGTLRAGSGVYHRVLQPPGLKGFALQIKRPTGGAIPMNVVPRLTVIRTR
jgi:hypothetical protein